MWRKSKCQEVKNGDQPKITETHAKHKTNGVSVTKEMSKGNQIVLTKTNALVTPTQGETVALVAKFWRSNKICTRCLSSLFSLLLKSFLVTILYDEQHTLFLYLFFSFSVFIFCFVTM